MWVGGLKSQRLHDKRCLSVFVIGVNPPGMPGTYPHQYLVGGDINGNVPTNIRDGNVVEYELVIASVKRKQR